MRNVIKVTGVNRKAVLAFLDKHMNEAFKPTNKLGLVVTRDNCFIELKGNTFTTHLKYNGETKTLKQVRELYEPKQTKNEKRLQGMASMYKLKYEQCRDSRMKQDRDIHLQLNSELRVKNTRLTDDLIRVESENKELKKSLEAEKTLHEYSLKELDQAKFDLKGQKMLLAVSSLIIITLCVIL